VVASISTDSPMKNTRSKRVNVAKKTKSKKMLLANLINDLNLYFDLCVLWTCVLISILDLCNWLWFELL
jgi:hypothetical protein